MPMESVMPSNHLMLRRPLLLLPSIFPSIGVNRFSTSADSERTVDSLDGTATAQTVPPLHIYTQV